jgi:hypothetical protein
MSNMCNALKLCYKYDGPHASSFSHLLHRLSLKIRPESRLSIQAALPDTLVACHQQLWKLVRPVAQVTLGQRPDLGFDCFIHILVMILLIAQRSQQIQHPIAGILPLLAQSIDKSVVQLAEEVSLMIQNFVAVLLEDGEVLGGRITRFALPVVGAIAKEVETLFGRPKEWVVHDLNSGGTVFGPGLEHPLDQVVWFFGVGTQTELLQIGLFLLDVVFANLHPAFVIVEGMTSVCQDVKEHAAEREDIDRTLDTLCHRISRAGRVARRPIRASVHQLLWLRDQFGCFPTNSAGVACRSNECADIIWQCFTQSKVRYDKSWAIRLVPRWVSDENILRLDVAVNDSQTVEMVESICQLV